MSNVVCMYLLFYHYFRGNANIYNENGVIVESLRDIKAHEHVPNPCVIGPNLYMITKDRLR